MPYPPITVNLLAEKGACKEQVILFRKAFGEGEAPLDDENAIKFASVFDFGWAARYLLNNEDLAKYNKACAPIVAEYQKAHAPIVAEYQKAHAPIYAEYEKARAPIWAEYQKAHAPIYAEYEKARALIFVGLYGEGS